MSQTDNRDNAGPGESLAAARAEREMSVADVAGHLRLPRTVIENIEAGRFDRIAAIYRRGYISNYARLVGLDPGPLLDALGDDEPEPLRSVLPVRSGGKRFDRFVKFATYALVTTVIVPPLVYFFVQGGARLFEPESGSDAALAAQDHDAPTTAASYRERVAEALPVQAAGDDAARGALSASALPVALRPQPPGPESAIAEAAPVEADAGVDSASATSRLELVLSEDSWVEIEDAEGERLEFDLLRSGQSRRYDGRPPFRVLLGRGSAVAIALNGEPVEFDGRDRAGVAEFMLGDPPAAGSAARAAE